MIPPDKYLTFRHKYFGAMSYKGNENFKELYINFLKNPSGNKCESFNNKLSDIELKVLTEACCIVFVLPTRYSYSDIWKQLRPELNKLMEFLKTIIKEDKLIVAWDVFYGKVEPKLKKAFAIIGIEHIMDVPFNDKNVMIPGNIFIIKNGKIVGDGLKVENCIDLFKSAYGVK